MLRKGLRLITFDATNTLIHVRGSVGDHYASACRKFYVKADPDKVAESFNKHWADMSAKHPCFGKFEMTSRDWWSRLVKNTIVDSGVHEEDVTPVFPEIFNSLWDGYCTGALWEVDKNARSLLDNLKERNLQVAVISNFDERLMTVLENVNLISYFYAPPHELSPLLITSSIEVGKEKPEKGIFDFAIKKANALVEEPLEPSMCLHVGDNLKKDALAAVAAGMKACLVKRNFSESMQRPTTKEPYYIVNNLDRILEVVDDINKNP